MNMVEFYKKMEALLNPTTKKESTKVVDLSAVTVIQPASTYSAIRPNADSAALSYANRSNDAEYDDYVYVEITDEENKVYQSAVNAGMEEAISNNRSELNKQMNIVVDQYMEYICNLDYQEDGIPLDSNKMSRLLNLLTGSINDFSKEYVETNKDRDVLIMAEVTKDFIKFAEKKINEYAEQMQVSKQNIDTLKDIDSNNLTDLKEIFASVTENGYMTQQEAKTAREAVTDYILAQMMNGAEEIPLVKTIDPKYAVNVNYTNAQKYIKEAERYEKAGDFVNAEKSYGKAYDAIAKMVSKTGISDLNAAVMYAGESDIPVEDDTTETPDTTPQKPAPNPGGNITEEEKNEYEKVIEELTNKVEQLQNIIKTLFDKISEVINDKNEDKTEESDDPETEPTMENIKENIEALKKLPADMGAYVQEIGSIFNDVVSAETLEEAQAAYERALNVYNQVKTQLAEAEARMNRLEKIMERAEAVAAKDGATDSQKQIAQSAANAYAAAQNLVDSLQKTADTAEKMKDAAKVIVDKKQGNETADTVEPSTPSTPSLPSENPDATPDTTDKATHEDYVNAFDVNDIITDADMVFYFQGDIVEFATQTAGTKADGLETAKKNFTERATQHMDTLGASIKSNLQEKLKDSYDASNVNKIIEAAKNAVIEKFTKTVPTSADDDDSNKAAVGEHTLMFDRNSSTNGYFTYDVGVMLSDFLNYVQSGLGNDSINTETDKDKIEVV